MDNTRKLDKLLKTPRHENEAHDWIFSLAPISVAFVFYVMFIMSANLEERGIFIAYGAAAGFIGLESYWIIRGWKNNHLSTILMGIIGIVLTLGLLQLYLSLIQ